MLPRSSPLADDLFRSLSQAAAPHATMAYALETGVGADGSLIVCTKPTCAPSNGPDGTRFEAMPLNQEDLDRLAIAQYSPVVCDICGAHLTEQVVGPDPRD